jgi:hypothetical protein
VVLSNAERQARHRDRLKGRVAVSYEIGVVQEQIAALETAVNEARVKVGLPEVQLPRLAK